MDFVVDALFGFEIQGFSRLMSSTEYSVSTCLTIIKNGSSACFPVLG